MDLSTEAMGSVIRPRVLFLCTHNSARSQMAEGLLRHLAGDRFEVHSAGTEATSVKPEAIAAMAEIGADVSGQESKTLERYLGELFEYVITVCDAANEACPVFPGAKNRLHWSFEDPSRATGTEEERLEVFRAVRDEIRERIEGELLLEEGRGPRSGRPDEGPPLRVSGAVRLQKTMDGPASIRVWTLFSGCCRGRGTTLPVIEVGSVYARNIGALRAVLCL